MAIKQQKSLIIISRVISYQQEQREVVYLHRNYNTMKTMNLNPSDHFFHCKANYEAASRGRYGVAVATGAGYLRELADTLIKRDSLSAARSDLRANARGRAGTATGKSLRATCPTHHTKYK